jgi:hypothetical protein
LNWANWSFSIVELNPDIIRLVLARRRYVDQDLAALEDDAEA